MRRSVYLLYTSASLMDGGKELFAPSPVRCKNARTESAARVTTRSWDHEQEAQ